MIGARMGNYRLIKKLGEGGMGIVFVAEHELMGKVAAVKVLLPQFSQNSDIVRRFFNEAKATGQLRHPGLVDIYDYGHHAETGSAFIVMELLEGESLAGKMRREGRIAEPLLVSLTRQVAAALGAAHAKGIVHRDLKPDNLFIIDDSTVACGLRAKVLDFGIAKLLSQEASAADSRTKTGALLGTPTYMAPEQCRGLSQLDQRADIYSLACIMYEMACGQPPFSGEGMGDVLAAHIYETPTPLIDRAPHVSPALATVVTRAMGKKPEQRYSTMAELASALALDAVTQPGLTVRPPVEPLRMNDGPITTLSGAASSRAVRPHAERGGRRSRTPWIVGASVVVVAAAAAILGPRVKPAPGASPSASSGPLPSSPSSQANAAARSPTTAPPPSATAIADSVSDSSNATPAQVTLVVESEPPGADVIRAGDGEQLGTTPWTTKARPSSKEIALLLKLRGYRPMTVVLTPVDDRTTHVKLLRAGKPKAAKSSELVNDGVADPF